MKKLIMFNMITLDGYFEGPGRDINWHTVDPEFNKFAIDQLAEIGTMIFGRVTYELMESFWPTKEALHNSPKIAALMNETPKVVCSTTMKSAAWNNTMLLSREVEGELQRLKSTAAKDLIIFGSAVLCSSLTKSKLIDEYRLMVSPIALGAGTPLFRDRMNMQLKASRRFSNGNILLAYTAAP